MTIVESRKVTSDVFESLKRISKEGLYETFADATEGLEVGQSQQLSPELIDAAADTLQEPMRTRVQAKLGLGKHRGDALRVRLLAFAATFDKNSYKSVPRSDQWAGLKSFAAILVRGDVPSGSSSEPISFTPYNKWEVLEYEQSRSMPTDSSESLVVQRRLIRSLVEGLSEFRIPQGVTWPSERMPAYRMLVGGICRIENDRRYHSRGHEGHRFDFVVKFPPMAVGEQRELNWITTYAHEDGDLYGVGETDSVDLTPVVSVESATFRVNFTIDHLPAEVWRFEDVPAVDRLDVTSERILLIPDNGVVEETFVRPRLGYSAGIGWRW